MYCVLMLISLPTSSTPLASAVHRLSLSTLNDDQLHRNQELARESSLQLTLLFADKSHTFTTTSQSQVLVRNKKVNDSSVLQDKSRRIQTWQVSVLLPFVSFHRVA